MKTMIGLLNEYAMPMRREDDLRFEDDDEFDFDMDSGEDDMDMDMDSGEDDMNMDMDSGEDDMDARMDDVEDKLNSVLSKFAEVIAKDMGDDMDSGEDDMNMDSGEDDMDMDMDSGEDDMRKERGTLRASNQSRMAKMLSDAVRYGQRNSKVSVEEAIDDLMAAYKK